jgi:hypothetical protein
MWPLHLVNSQTTSTMVPRPALSDLEREKGEPRAR